MTISEVSDLVNWEEIGAEIWNIENISELPIFHFYISFSFNFHLCIISHEDMWYLWLVQWTKIFLWRTYMIWGIWVKYPFWTRTCVCHKCLPFPFEEDGVESLEVPSTWILFFLSRFSNSSILLVLQWCSSWFGFLQYAQKKLSFSLFPFLLEEELPCCEEEDCCFLDCDFRFHYFFLLVVELFPLY